MEHLSEEIANFISHLSEENFYKLVKNFTKEYYNTKEVIISNGPYDGGIDMEIRTEKQLIKRNIQITIQKTKLKDKIEEDVKKAADNVTNFDYARVLEFYCTQPISSQKQREFKRDAKVNYSIDLEIYDSTYFGEMSDEYSSIKETVYEIYNVPIENEPLELSKQTKVLFDLLAIGKDTGELQRQFIHSLIFTYLYEFPNSSENDLVKNIETQLSGAGDANNLIRGQISSLRVKGHINTGSEKGHLVLSDEKTKQINDILSITNSQEALLYVEIETALTPFNLRGNSAEVVSFIYQAFQENYDTDFEELTKGSSQHSASIKKTYNSLKGFIAKKIDDENNTKLLADELIKICSNNEFLNKMSASILFTKLYHSDKLDAYINEREMELLLDTQILLRLLCLQYDSFEFEDSAFQNVRLLHDTVKEFPERIVLKTTIDYVEEVVGHIIEAIKLNRFLSLPVFEGKKLKSKNVFYNYFIAFNQHHANSDEFDLIDFFDDLLGVEVPEINDAKFRPILRGTIEQIFDFLGIVVIHHETYSNYLSVKHAYDYILSGSYKVRSYLARENDLRTIIYLSTKELHVRNGFINEAFLVTWDTLFYTIRKEILEKIKPYSYWYIYTPSKIADRISLQHFKLNPRAINQNIISITESNFNLSSTTTTFIDLMSTLFNKSDLSDVKLAQRLIQLNNQSKPHSEEPVVEDVHQDNTAYTQILLELKNHYSRPATGGYNLDNLSELFENDNEFENVDKLIVENEEYYNKHSKIKETLFQEIDKLISQLNPSA